MRISDWSSDVCSSDLRAQHAGDHEPGRTHLLPGARRAAGRRRPGGHPERPARGRRLPGSALMGAREEAQRPDTPQQVRGYGQGGVETVISVEDVNRQAAALATGGISESRLAELVGATPFVEIRSEEHTSELQSLMRISYAVFCLKKQT